MAKAKQKQPTDDLLKELRAFGLAYPGAHLKSPWPGHLDLAVNDKTFTYLSVDGEPLAISCKLPRSSAMALMLPFCKPTAYGLGKSGWVSASFDDAEVDVAMLKAWIDESYRAQAPKKLVASLAAGGAAPAGDAKPAKRAAAKPPAMRAAAKPPAMRAAAKPPAKRAAAKPR
jgi:predicted DNA-binding protein (MmcQ/YjbR family)